MTLLSVQVKRNHRFKHYARFETREQAQQFGDYLVQIGDIHAYRLKEIRGE